MQIELTESQAKAFALNIVRNISEYVASHPKEYTEFLKTNGYYGNNSTASPKGVAINNLNIEERRTGHVREK